MPREGVVNTLVVENDDENGNRVLTDFISYYHLPSQILKCKDAQHDYKTINIAYLFYYSCTKNDLKTLMTYILIYAKNISEREEGCTDQIEYDVFNCLNIADNMSFIKELKFGPGDGALNYYMFNYLVKDPGFISAKDMCAVLV